MSSFAAILPLVGRAVTDNTVSIDTQGIVTHSSFLPETSEVIYGSIASVMIFVLLAKFAWPALKKGLDGRTAKIQKELDGAASDKSAAADEAASIRQAKGDIQAERTRLLDEAAAQSAALVTDFNTRVDAEIADLHARATADIETARSRQGDELRAEISRMSATAAEWAVAQSIDDATHQQLIENFIQTVGLQTAGATTAGAAS